MMQAHVIRFVPPFRPQEVSKLYYHDVDFQMQLRNCPPWVDRPLRYTGDLARNFSGAAFLAMAAASCRLRKSGSLKPLIYSGLASNADDLPVCAVPNSVNARANRPLLLRWGCLFPVLPSTAPPSTQERNDISADVILAKELKRLICRWHAFVKGIDSCLACHHAALISVPTRSA
jgi:hypothetical protein